MPRYTIPEEIELLVEAGLLTERQAEAYVYRSVEGQPLHLVAEEMNVSKQAVSDYDNAAQEKIDEAEATLTVLNEIQNQVPSECSECGTALSNPYVTTDEWEPLCWGCADIDRNNIDL